MRFRLRTLLIVLALGPLVIAGFCVLAMRDTRPYGLVLGSVIATVTVTLLLAGPLLALDWLLKKD